MKLFARILFAALISSAAAATELVVIESTSTAYEPGQTVTENDRIVVEEGADIVLLSEDGVVIAVVGPFDEPLTPVESEDDYDILRALGVLVGESEVNARSIGGVRFGGVEYPDIDPSRDVPDTRDSPWSVHVGMGGTQCVPQDSRTVSYWREDGSRVQQLNVRHLASGESGVFAWQAGERTLDWPQDVPLAYDDVYVLRVDDELRSVALLLRSVPTAVTMNDRASVAWLAARGCLSQARLVLASLQ